jgi:hypothetical protein
MRLEVWSLHTAEATNSPRIHPQPPPSTTRREICVSRFALIDGNGAISLAQNTEKFTRRIGLWIHSPDRAHESNRHMKTQKSTDNAKPPRRREFVPLSPQDALSLLELMVSGEIEPAGHVCEWSNNSEGQCVLTIKTASYYDYEGKRGIAMFDPYWKRVEQRKAQAQAGIQTQTTVNPIKAMADAVVAHARASDDGI